MVYKTLAEMITFLEYGTKLHIGVLFFGNHGNEMCTLPHSRIIHISPLCDMFKNQSKKGYDRCFACRNLALKKAIATKQSFGDICINGIYEYTRPVIVDDEVVCIIYIGNVFDEKNKDRLYSRIGGHYELLDSLEKGLSQQDIGIICDLIEGHIRTLLEKFPTKAAGNPLVENIKSYIVDNLEYNITISLIADIFHYNKLYLGRLFKKETGESITDFINAQRLKRAARLLKDTEQSILSVANRTGFNNVTYFNRLFKNFYEVSPKEYRASHRKND